MDDQLEGRDGDLYRGVVYNPMLYYIKLGAG